MTDPLTVVGAISAVDSLLDVSSKALDLLRRTRKASGPKDSPDAKLLALALLDVRHNLAVLDCLQLKGVEGADPAVDAAAGVLRLDSIVAMLVRWPSPGAEPDLSSTAGYSTRKDFDDWDAAQDQRDRRGQLLAHGVFIATRVQALRSLVRLPAHIVRPLRPDIRFSNIKRAHLALAKQLGDEEALKHLSTPRRRGKGADSQG